MDEREWNFNGTQTNSLSRPLALCGVSDIAMIEQCVYTATFSHTIFSLFVLMLLNTHKHNEI